MLTHRNILTGRRTAIDMAWNNWKPDDISLVAMPVAHIGGTGWGIVGLLNGAKSVVAREFNACEVLDFIERDRVTKIFMVPGGTTDDRTSAACASGGLQSSQIHFVRSLSDPPRSAARMHGSIRLRFSASNTA